MSFTKRSDTHNPYDHGGCYLNALHSDANANLRPRPRRSLSQRWYSGLWRPWLSILNFARAMVSKLAKNSIIHKIPDERTKVSRIGLLTL
jgi:hypothetical protein